MWRKYDGNYRKIEVGIIKRELVNEAYRGYGYGLFVLRFRDIFDESHSKAAVIPRLGLSQFSVSLGLSITVRAL